MGAAAAAAGADKGTIGLGYHSSKALWQAHKLCVRAYPCTRCPFYRGQADFLFISWLWWWIAPNIKSFLLQNHFVILETTIAIFAKAILAIAITVFAKAILAIAIAILVSCKPTESPGGWLWHLCHHPWWASTRARVGKAGKLRCGNLSLCRLTHQAGVFVWVVYV